MAAPVAIVVPAVVAAPAAVAVPMAVVMHLAVITLNVQNVLGIAITLVVLLCQHFVVLFYHNDLLCVHVYKVLVHLVKQQSTLNKALASLAWDCGSFDGFG